MILLKVELNYLKTTEFTQQLFQNLGFIRPPFIFYPRKWDKK